MDIPDTAKNLLIPHNDLSISEFVQFNMPICLTSYSIPPMTILKDLYFHDTKVTAVDISILYFIPSPPISIVLALEKALSTAIKSGKCSVKCPHVKTTEGNTYPTWIVAYWAKIVPIQEHCSRWLVLKDVLQAQVEAGLDSEVGGPTGTTGRTRAQEVLEMLAATPWTQKLHGFSTNAGTSLDTLTVYGTNEWFNDKNANQALDLLQMKADIQECDGFQVTSTWFYSKIEQALGKNNAYLQESSFCSHQHMGQSLETGIYDQLAMLINVERMHWVCTVLDFRGRTIHYGDSQGFSIPISIKAGHK